MHLRGIWIRQLPIPQPVSVKTSRFQAIHYSFVKWQVSFGIRCHICDHFGFMSFPGRRVAQNVISVTQKQKENEDKSKQAKHCGYDERSILLCVCVFRQTVISLIIVAVVAESRYWLFNSHSQRPSRMSHSAGRAWTRIFQCSARQHIHLFSRPIQKQWWSNLEMHASQSLQCFVR